MLCTFFESLLDHVLWTRSCTSTSRKQFIKAVVHCLCLERFRFQCCFSSYLLLVIKFHLVKKTLALFIICHSLKVLFNSLSIVIPSNKFPQCSPEVGLSCQKTLLRLTCSLHPCWALHHDPCPVCLLCFLCTWASLSEPA